MTKRLNWWQRASCHTVRPRGFPMLARVLNYTAGNPACMPTPRSPGAPPEPEEVERELYDRKGYPADWLVAKMSEQELRDLDAEVAESEIAANENARAEAMEP